ncbi:hypothetical protein N7492_007606 [Penicillium capsulatum]|uniref:Uncharacterized protein n=1 Tax=Penicillium capsulatum TaxID=69766 RepID=A0A9W9LLV1_9EURO|nr:hypothetical protein N7492_007606 [Penicillium capsulatum]KAJ6117441.1 hypothetical protein N7512_007166 [Penicillium capsulatum]
MKLSALALLCATAVAVPLQGVIPSSSTSTSTSSTSGASQVQPDTAPRASPQLSASVYRYFARLHRSAEALLAEYSPAAQPTPSESTSSPEPTHEDDAYHRNLMLSFRDLDRRYKELAEKAHPHKRRAVSPDSEAQLKPAMHRVLSHHGPECVALVIFFLAPVSYLFFYVLGLLFRKLTQDRSTPVGRAYLDSPEKNVASTDSQDSLGDKFWPAQEKC